MKHLLLIINPIAGTRKASRKLSQIISIFSNAGYRTHVHVTRNPGDAAQAVRVHGPHSELIVCCGGDGTLNETVGGLRECRLSVPLGYIPAGSTNDYAKTLGLSTDLVEAARQIVRGKVHRYDLGLFCGRRHFNYVASFGAFTAASYSCSQRSKNLLGHFAYLLQGLRELPRIHSEHLRVELDGRVLEGDYLFGAICNSTSVAGVLTLDRTRVDLQDGKFELLLIRPPKNTKELTRCICALYSSRLDCDMITFCSASRLRITASPRLAWSLDGERAEGRRTVTIKNLHHALQLIH